MVFGCATLYDALLYSKHALWRTVYQVYPTVVCISFSYLGVPIHTATLRKGAGSNETMSTAVFCIDIEKVPNPTHGFLQRKTQDALYNSLVNFCIEQFRIDRSKYTKTQLTDTHQVFEVDGTEEACNKMLESLEKIDNTQMEKFYGKISNIRMMPAFIRRKVMSAKNAVTQGSWEKLQQVCMMFNIIIYAEVRNEKKD
jgi:hypothetical protein